MIVIAGQIVRTPDKYAEIDQAEMPILANVLRTIWLTEMTKRLNAFADEWIATTTFPETELLRRVLLKRALRIEAARLQSIDLLSEIETDPNKSAVEAEAIQIATARIAAHLAQHNLAGPPWPPDRRGHIEFQAKSPKILTEARQRVEAKLLAGADLVAEHKKGTPPEPSGAQS